MTFKQLIAVFILGVILYFVWNLLLDGVVVEKNITDKNFKKIEVTYKPEALIVILSNDKRGN